MHSAIWAVAAAVALLWPSRLAGPLDGVPLDQPFEAVLIGLAFTWLLATHVSFLRLPAVRSVVVALFMWKVLTGTALEQDGWCLRFTTEVPVYRDGVTVPHSWDVRADWRAAVPQCSAVMTRSYPVLERFSAWFFNLAPADPLRPAAPADRPPSVTTAVEVTGFLHVSSPGVFRLTMDEDVHVATRVDDGLIDAADLARGVELASGLHRVSIAGSLVRSHWSLSPTWNGTDVWRGAVATMAPPSAVDTWVRPWGRFVTPLLVAALVLAGLASVIRRVGLGATIWLTLGLSAAMVMLGLSERTALIRASVLLLMAAAAVKLPRQLRSTFGASLLVVAPMVALFAVIGWSQVGLFTWYSSGDDWWTFQRFAYRIFLQGYWLEGGEQTFWFQPGYRWIAGALHLAFGDSSVGELFWDLGGAVVGALFAFRVTKTFAGFRWGIAAAVVTLSLFLLGPAWYLFGRGLSEFSSAGFIYLAALFALRARGGYWPAALAAGALATLGFYTRLNNLPMALAIAAFALPVRQPIGGWWRVPEWTPRLSRPVLAGVLGAVAVGLWLFAARTYYYTGIPSILHGTTAGLNSVWQPGDTFPTALARLASSLMMLLTLNDPPRFDVRALPVLVGFGVAVFGLAGLGRLARLPMNLVVLCFAGVAGAFVARGSAYPGRFSTHLIPVTVALALCAASLFFRSPAVGRDSRDEA